jgi:hypothetical protein
LTAVKQNPLALKYVQKQTEEICLEAIKQNIRAYKYVKNRTKEIYRVAHEIDPLINLRFLGSISCSFPYAGYDINRKQDVNVYGTIKSETGLTVPIGNVRISFLNIDNTGLSDDSGKFTVYVPYQESYIVNFTDPSGKYASKTIKTKGRDLKTVTLAEKGGE